MADVFDLNQLEWSFRAAPSSYLLNTQLPLPKTSATPIEIPKPTHSAAYWATRTAEFDFSKEDNLGSPQKFNRIIWEGLKGDVPYPSARTSADLRLERPRYLRLSIDGAGSTP